MKTTSRSLAIIILVISIVLVGSLPACSRKPPQNLTMWVYMSDAELATVNSVVDSWEKKTGNQVEVVNYPYFEMLSKVEIAFPGGEGPDLFEFPHTDTGVWAQAGLIAPFPADALTEDERANYLASAIDAFTYNSQLYGIPEIADTVVLMYNKALISTPPATMDELVQAAGQLTKGDIYGFLVLDDNMWFSWPFISGYGGYIFGKQAGNYNIGDLGIFTKKTSDAMDYLMTFRNQDKLIPKDLNWSVITGKFTEGKVAMMLMNASQAGIYEKAGVDVGIGVIPTLPNGATPEPLLNVHGWGLNAYSKSQAASADLALYLGANLPIPLYKVSSGNIPVRSDVLSDPVIADDPDAVAAVKQVENSQPVPNVPEMSLVWTPLDNAFKLVASGEETPAQALLEATQAIKDAIAGQE
jgi:arabinogalactan oligomer / maltooligosaccharide transport system substrate-binding protein